MAKYNKNILIQQRNKYNDAISKINSSISKLQSIKDELSDKGRYGGVDAVSLSINSIDSAISDLKVTKAKLDITISKLTTEINRPDEEDKKVVLESEK